MSKSKSKIRYLCGDFETTVFENQTFTEVWASVICELGSEEVSVFHSLPDTFDYLKSLKSNIIIYYHNLKFDGSFWLDWIAKNPKFHEAIDMDIDPDDGHIIKADFHAPTELKNNEYRYTISDRGQWYQILIKVNNYTIDIRDSLKLLPFSIKKIGKDFKTKHQKSSMEYTGFRYAGCNITKDEEEYIKNDGYVLKEALEIMYDAGHTKLTIGSCCMSEYKSIIGKNLFDGLFPDLSNFQLNTEHYEQNNADEYIRKAYKGGWCYLVKGKELKRYHNGITADVNSLYPSVMHSESGNRYPVGLPTFWHGNFIPEAAKREDRYYFIRIKTRFYIKPNKLPFIQIKGDFRYKGTECLESSDYVDPKTGIHSIYTIDFDGNKHDTRCTLTMTCTDFELVKEHYDLIDFEILGGCYFTTRIGLFDEYIDEYKHIKLESKGAWRTIAKLFLNNLYGKFATNDNSSFKHLYIRDDKAIGFDNVEAHDKDVLYIPVGAAVTSYARNFTIRAAQKNYHGKDKPGFIYADTDSIHCDLSPDELVDISVHDTAFNHWKLEASWDIGYFVRQKTYIEHVVAEDLKPIDKPYYNIKCAGMPDRCKDVVNKSLCGYSVKDGDKFTPEQIELINRHIKLEDIKPGFKVYGKLIPKRIEGGIILQETTYELR